VRDGEVVLQLGNALQQRLVRHGLVRLRLEQVDARDVAHLLSARSKS
jgi:hypothetical protein